MDTIFEIFLGTIGTIISLAALFAGFGYFRQGRNQARIDANILLKDDVDALTKKVNLQAEDIEKLTNKVTQMEGVILEKDKKLAETLLILQGRDPQLITFVETVKKYIETNIPLLETIKTETIPTLEKLDKYLNKQTF